jgi:hypothetical protein
LVAGLALGFAIEIARDEGRSGGTTGSSTSSDSPRVSATIEEVLADPGAYSGKRVTLAGQLDECAGWECSLCPAQMTVQTRDHAKCLPLSFRSLIPETGFGSGEKEEVLRFSDVVLTASFDSTCLSPGRCLDRQVVLRDAEAVSIGERRSSRSGLWLGDTTPLKELEEPLVGELRAAALEAGFPENPPFKAFAAIGTEPEVVVCWTPPIEPASWPNTLEGALHAPSTKDFYECRAARKIEGRWVIQAIG